MASYEESIFINCPFDLEYRPIFQALVFAVHECGYFARCALEVEDSGQVRIQKIEQIIAECRFGVHDISRTKADPENQLPRFNMPLELGLFLGAKRYGDARQQIKLGGHDVPTGVLASPGGRKETDKMQKVTDGYGTTSHRAAV